MKRNFSFVLLATMAFSLLLPFQRPQTVHADDTGTLVLNEPDQEETMVIPEKDVNDPNSGFEFGTFDDPSELQVVSSDPSVLEISDVSGKVDAYRIGAESPILHVSAFTGLIITYRCHPKALGTATVTALYNNQVISTDQNFPSTATYKVTASRNSSVPMYRLYNPNSSEHFYTFNEKERNNLISLGWADEGTGWNAPSDGNPVYRLYNANGGEHHYTLSEKEKNALVAAGWKDEGIGWYSDSGNAVPVYRQYNPNMFANNHNYTTSEKERDYLVSLGWKDEGTAWYGVN